MDVYWDHPAAIRVADVLRYLCLLVGMGFSGAVIRLTRNPRVQTHPTFRGFRARLTALALGVALSMVLQYQRLGEPVNLILLPLSVVLLATAFYSVWLPVADIREEASERKLRELRDL